MSSQYSSLFASGLLAQRTNTTPTDLTPTFDFPPTSSGSLAPALNIATQPTSPRVDPSRPRLRKRRSSLTVGATSPIGGLKSPIRTAGAAFQRQILMSPSSRARSGSVNDASEGTTSLVSRLRSGSLSTAKARRYVRNATNPPNAPLPPIPGASSADEPSKSSRPIPLLSSAFEWFPPRRPLAHRAETTASVLSTFLGPSSNEDATSYLTPDFANKLALALSTPPSSRPGTPEPPKGYFEAHMDMISDSPIRR